MDNARLIWDKLLASGLTQAGAAGLMGNLQAESGLDPQNLQNSFEKKLGMSDQEYTVAVDCGAYTGFVTDGAGYGLAQWTNANRKQLLLYFARVGASSVGNLDIQMDYLIWELREKFPAVWDKLRSTNSVREASDRVLLKFERPADQSAANCARRAALGQEFYDRFAEEGGDRMKLLKCLLTENRCYQAGAKLRSIGVMVHSTGCNNPDLRRYVQPVPSTPGRAELAAALGENRNGNHWNRPGLDVCVHGFIGKLADGSVAAVQTLPWDVRGWHAGRGEKGSANDTHISFEICEDGLTDPAYFQQAYRVAVELTAMLCWEHGLDPLADGVVICHQEGYRRGIASNHGDVLHWFPKHGKDMQDFRADVARAMNKEEDDEMKYYACYDDIPEYYQGAVLKAMSVGALQGEEKDKDGVPILNVSEDLCRTLTVLDRLGKLE